MFENLKKNLEHEKKLVADMRSVAVAMQGDVAHRAFYLSNMKALVGQLRLLNRTVPDLLKEGSSTPQFAEVKKKAPAVNKSVNVSYVSPSEKEKKYVTIDKGSRREFLEKLKLSEDSLRGLKKAHKKDGVKIERKPNKYMKFSNRFFLNQSEKLAPNFKDLSVDLKKGNNTLLFAVSEDFGGWGITGKFTDPEGVTVF